MCVVAELVDTLRNQFKQSTSAHSTNFALATKPTVQDLMPLVDRIERRVSATFMLMSYSGRVSLINSLLTSITTFSMCSIQLHPKILEHIETN
jgi:hypothetical protein